MEKSQLHILPGTKPVQKKPFHERRWVKLSLMVVSVIMKIRPIQRYIDNTCAGMKGLISRCLREKNYEEALSIAHAGMRKSRQDSHRMLAQYDWWNFMYYAVCCAEELGSVDEREKLISIAESGFEPFQGFYAACTFCFFSRWMYEVKNYDAAIEYARRAINADGKLAEADFLLGWYALFLDQQDPTEHFRSAIMKDNTYLAKIVHEPALNEQFPHLIDQLRNLSVVRNNDKP